MAKFTGAAQVFDTDSSTVGSATVVTSPQLGTRARDAAGNEYIFLNGVASCAFGDFVTYNPVTYNTTRLLSTSTAGRTGPVAVAGTAVVASQVGWFQIYGVTPNAAVNIATDSGATYGSALYVSSTAGRATTTSAAGTIIFGASATAAPASNLGTALLIYPWASGTSTV